MNLQLIFNQLIVLLGGVHPGGAAQGRERQRGRARVSPGRCYFTVKNWKII